MPVSAVFSRLALMSVLLIATGVLTPVHAATGDVMVSGGWVRPSAAKTGAAYLTLTNNGATADVLTGVESPAAAKVQIHTMEMDGNIMRMRKLDGLALPARESVSLAPGGLHIMLIGLTGPLNAGDEVELHLSFEHAGGLDVRLPVQSKPPVAATPSDNGMHSTPGMADHP
tara:strand:- start:128 stop:640 length:513 start_codon:yes stop_codon:yes gene_type:complete